MIEDHKPTSAEKLYDFAPGGTYLAPVMVGFPLDILLERGEEIRNYSGGDPELLEQGQQANRWEVKPGRRAAMRRCGRISFCGPRSLGSKWGWSLRPRSAFII